jgi:1,4-alpha-glucan branching enzyme
LLDEARWSIPKGAFTMTAATDIDRLVARDHHDPHALLGAHPAKGGVVVRALHPAAESIVLQPAGVELRRVHPGGIFEGELKGAKLPVDYELEIRFPDGNTFTTPDPYRFAPTLSDLTVCAGRRSPSGRRPPAR